MRREREKLPLDKGVFLTIINCISFQFPNLEPMSALKDQIADSFQKRFNYFGLKKTSVDEVAKELHISKKTIYQNFSTKEEVFYYVVSRVARQYRVSMEKDIEAYSSYQKKLEHWSG